jgi:UDP-N-acetylmuramoyl-tripeptide--D-alanyl-D-alanine ligase
MTPLWTSSEMAQATGGTASGDFAVESVHIDSRDVEPGALFVALKGEATDGHRFLEQAFAAGASAALVSDVSQLPAASSPHLLVPDVQEGMRALARVARARVQGPVAGITGSAGKTGVKEGIRQALERFRPMQVHASIRSFNNHVGVPLTLARMRRESRFAVLEMGMNHAGELTDLSALAQPDVVAITTVASAHRAFFDSEEAIADAKGEICGGLKPGGTIILNADNRHHARLRAIAERSNAGRIISFGWHQPADVRALSVELQPETSTVMADIMGDEMMFKVAQPGAHWVLNALCILAVVKSLDGDLGLAGLALAEMQGLAGRGQRVTLSTRDGGTATLIDESYNANPASMAAALSVLGGVTPAHGGRRIAVLGDMRELGDLSAASHSELAAPLVAANVQMAICVGADMALLHDMLQDSVKSVRAADAAEAEALLAQILRDGDVVLVKGSNSMGLGMLVKTLSSKK